jgi:hypothetical protein
MKKILPVLLLQCLFATACFSQNMIAKVPSSAALVLKYSGSSLSEKLPATKFDSYTSLKKKLFEELKIDPKTTLDDMGIDLQQDAYEYLTLSDTTTAFVTLAAIKDAAKFNQFVQKKNSKNTPVENKTGFQLYPISKTIFLGWDGKLATLVVLNYTDNAYYQASYIVDSSKMFSDVGKTTPYADSSVVLEAAPSVDSTKMAVDTAMIAADSAKIAIAGDSAVAQPETKEEIAEREAREKFYVDQEIKDSAVKKELAENILFSVYDSTFTSIQSNASYNKLVDNSSDISVWVSPAAILNRWYGYIHNLPYSHRDNFTGWLGYTQAVNVFFEGTKVRIVQNLSAGNDSLTKLFKDVFNSKQSPSLINYLNNSDLGYLSVSLNTEAMINYYYPLMKSVFGGMPDTKKYSEIIDTYIDLLQIIIDEKSIADMVPGNALFVLHSLKQKQVDYIAYDYDKNFNTIQTKKTKTEMSPDFSFIFETRNEKIFNEFAHLPVKLGKQMHFNYTKTGDYYTLVLGKDSYVDNLYFMVKDGKCIITTSLQDIASPRTSNVGAAIKESILNSNYSGRFNMEGFLKGLSGEVTEKKNKKIVNYLQNNISDMTFESHLKDDIIQTTATLNIAGDHKNSLQYFFDVIDKILDIDMSEK